MELVVYCEQAESTMDTCSRINPDICMNCTLEGIHDDRDTDPSKDNGKGVCENKHDDHQSVNFKNQQERTNAGEES